LSDSLAINANSCPSVTGIASNSQNDTDKFSPPSGRIRKKIRIEITWKIRIFHRRSVTGHPIYPVVVVRFTAWSTPINARTGVVLTI
jgi:hypothetical protein